jgi:hypothetical protein
MSAHGRCGAAVTQSGPARNSADSVRHFTEVAIHVIRREGPNHFERVRDELPVISKEGRLGVLAAAMGFLRRAGLGEREVPIRLPQGRLSTRLGMTLGERDDGARVARCV